MSVQHIRMNCIFGCTTSIFKSADVNTQVPWLSEMLFGLRIPGRRRSVRHIKPPPSSQLLPPVAATDNGVVSLRLLVIFELQVHSKSGPPYTAAAFTYLLCSGHAVPVRAPVDSRKGHEPRLKSRLPSYPWLLLGQSSMFAIEM
ncbi:hypothetical protein PILCRDRAFT_258432 [Piloderma croceum F 1598]|uniref:Uncharacterized protein n=1 Tax=Piloderma croceum (strain F 1598) TaxID=765440 RepID=A0A0C3GAQ7_PILCF|nr:hypothetical protein PILCRDRAFT_258432 [Piloderma croceum F 1598]